jgi:putative ABC transport system substrate-binding protein
MRRLGFVGSTGAQIRVAPFEEGLREWGYLEGQNVRTEHRWADTNEDLRAAITDLVDHGVEVLVTAGGAATGLAWAVTKNVPIVGVNFTVGSPFAPALARTGTNVTGVVGTVAGLGSKRLELLQQTIPSAARIAALWSGYRSTAGGGGGQSNMAREWQEISDAASALGVQLQDVELVRLNQSLEAMFAAAVGDGAQAAVVLGDPVFDPHRARVVELAAITRLPSIYTQRDFTDLGGLLSYGTSFPALYRQAARFVDKILKGANAGDLPVEQPTTFDLVVNLKTAQALGLTIPPSVLQQASEIIQ